MNLSVFPPLRRIDELDRLVDGFFSNARNRPASSPAPSRSWRPAADLVSDEKSYVIRFDLPGVSTEDIDIDFADGVLTVQGKRPDPFEKKAADAAETAETANAGQTVLRREIYSGQFRRAFRLPDDVDSASISAAFSDGVLEVKVPKSAAAQARRIPIGRA